MAKRNQLIRATTRPLGRRTEEPTFWRCSKTKRKSEEEGIITDTLPFLFSLTEIDVSPPKDTETTKFLERVVSRHTFRIPRHYLGLIDFENPLCPIRGQAIPSVMEEECGGSEDPLGEKGISLTPILLRRHPDRCVFLVSSECAMYCRFCNRRRFAGKAIDPEPYLEQSYDLIENDARIREVILSGGDPFMLESEKLRSILERLRSMKKRLIIRLSTRIPVVHPGGLSGGHIRAIEKASPLWVVVHINHPREITEEFLSAVNSIRRAGGIVVSQTVLLRNINDCPHILLNLFESLVEAGVKPYYLFQLDDVQGASHFKVKLERGREIMAFLRLNASGLAVPRYALDIPGGLGKIPVDAEHVRRQEGASVVQLVSPSGEIGFYDDNGQESVCMKCGICEETGTGL
jgi:lysine 2,3-aminomutase